MPEITVLSPSEQVASYLRRELLRGRWRETMPGVPKLAAVLGVDHKAVTSAIELLEEAGLLIGQGAGRPRRIVLSEAKIEAPTMRVALLESNSGDRGWAVMIELWHQLQEAGHAPFFPDKNLQDLGMDVGRVASMVRGTEADAWVVVSGSKAVLEWFAEQKAPAFAFAGRRGELPIAGTGPDKITATAVATRRLIALGHRRISTLCRRHVRLPRPVRSLRAFLGELEAVGIRTGEFNLPEWKESREGFEHVLDALFERTPPTALILDEAYLYYAAFHYLAGRGLRVPQDVSLICTDGDPGFVWCKPSVSHIRWDYLPVVHRIVRWVDNVTRGKNDRRQNFTKAEFVEGGTVGPKPVAR